MVEGPQEASSMNAHRRRTRHGAAIAFAAALALPTLASASERPIATPAPLDLGLRDGAPAARPILNLLARAPRAGRTAEQEAMRAAGLARTSVDRRLDDGVTGSLGFLCGIEPGFAGNAITGSDPHGRFLGAKLSFGF
jgi:hypothetical protein